LSRDGGGAAALGRRRDVVERRVSSIASPWAWETDRVAPSGPRRWGAVTPGNGSG
jgi:hypothetical protein